jgi:predicted TIM-barrel fold metal-dependent hydrolase
MIVTDAQVHLWGPNVPERPWREGQSVPGQPDKPFEISYILGAMDAAGVDRAVLIPHGERNGLDPAGVNDLALKATVEHPARFGVMGVVWSFDDPSLVDLASWKRPGMLGVRISNRQSRTGILGDGRADWFFRGASRYNIPVMLYAPGRNAEVHALASRYPDVRILLDHLNMPSPLEHSLSEHIEEAIGFARYPNVAAKVTALPRFAPGEPWPYATLHPHIRRVVDAFGADRCMWGSDLSGLPVPYGDWVRAVTEGMDFLTSSEKEQIMGGSLARWLAWPSA